MSNLRLAIRTLWATANRVVRGHPVADLGHRRQRGDLLCRRQPPAASAAGEGTRAGSSSWSRPPRISNDRGRIPSGTRSAAGQLSMAHSRGQPIVSISPPAARPSSWMASGRAGPCSTRSAYRPILGRTFTDQDDRRGGGPDGPVAVISYGFWQRRFGGAADAVGRRLDIERVPVTVIGVTHRASSARTWVAHSTSRFRSGSNRWCAAVKRGSMAGPPGGFR